MVEIHLPQPFVLISNQRLTQYSRLRVLLHFTDNTYNLGVLASVWQAAILNYPDRNRKIIQRARENSPKDRLLRITQSVGELLFGFHFDE
jgi:hypothetical protein